MHPALEGIKLELQQIVAAINSTVPNNEPISVAHGQWNIAGITRDELTGAATALIELLDVSSESIKTPSAGLTDFPRRLTFLRVNTVPQLWSANASFSIPAYLLTLDTLREALKPTVVSTSDAFEAAKSLQQLLKQLRATETRVAAAVPRAEQLDGMIERIEKAHEAADQLPTDLETLEESRDQVELLLSGATTDRGEMTSILKNSVIIKDQMIKSAEEANAILERCQEAYRASTSQGLASAFAERAKSLSFSMWVWVAGLVAALVLGYVFGSRQFQTTSELLRNSTDQHSGALWINLILSLLSVGAPIWFAWVATKQIGQRFRLAEDYGYKASISKAYEGYRREAALIDPAFQSRLFASALDRLDELPLRLVETDTHGSPWHELASSNLVSQAVRTVPNFMEKVTELAKNGVASISKPADQAAPVKAASSVE
jgi:hypothetical protein